MTEKEIELTGYERSLISTSYSFSDATKLPECPIKGLKSITYKKGKRAYLLKQLDPELAEVLREDKLYGKSTLVRSVFPAKDENGEPTGRTVVSYMVYFGIRWARLQKICELWGVELVEIKPQ